MRGPLAFLVVCVVAALISPGFWWLLASEYGAAPAMRIDQSGHATPSLTGPRAPWPEWARLPTARKLVVRMAEPSNGFGVVELEGDRHGQRPRSSGRSTTRAGVSAPGGRSCAIQTDLLRRRRCASCRLSRMRRAHSLNARFSCSSGARRSRSPSMYSGTRRACRRRRTVTRSAAEPRAI